MRQRRGRWEYSQLSILPVVRFVKLLCVQRTDGACLHETAWKLNCSTLYTLHWRDLMSIWLLKPFYCLILTSKNEIEKNTCFGF